ncbi:hypothetical protein [Streptomyces triticirhizae]|uniref:hypothetical protein n=1 Tax=Streptomyces triticirhizae TaxID=2483353 RepID=UPI0018F7A065|nr:hypothetical protein [Streptomyces triticirhizae]
MGRGNGARPDRAPGGGIRRGVLGSFAGALLEWYDFFIYGTASALVIGYNLGPTAMLAVQPTMFARRFGTRVRYTGLSLAYQVSAILGGLTPLIASALLAAGGGAPWLVAAFTTAVAVLSWLCVRAITTTPPTPTTTPAPHPTTEPVPH